MRRAPGPPRLLHTNNFGSQSARLPSVSEDSGSPLPGSASPARLPPATLLVRPRRPRWRQRWREEALPHPPAGLDGPCPLLRLHLRPRLRPLLSLRLRPHPRRHPRLRHLLRRRHSRRLGGGRQSFPVGHTNRVRALWRRWQADRSTWESLLVPRRQRKRRGFACMRAGTWAQSRPHVQTALPTARGPSTASRPWTVCMSREPAAGCTHGVPRRLGTGVHGGAGRPYHRPRWR